MMARLLRLLCLALLCAAALAGWPFREGKTKPKSGSAKTVSSLQIGVKRKAPCERAATDGDRVWVEYRGSLLDGGEQFDASYDRGTPFDFVLGKGNVIQGWDRGVSGMCPGELRKLKIPAELGYGERGSPPKIPGGASLVFEVELLSIGQPPAAKAEL